MVVWGGVLASTTLTTIEALIAALGIAVAHVINEYLHQYGHALAARRVGYPMKGIRFWWIFGQSRYPRDEGELPAKIHVHRALGGPIFSALVSILYGSVAMIMGDDNLLGVIAWGAFLDNLLIFTLGALLPLGFTDGSTLLYWVPKLKERS